MARPADATPKGNRVLREDERPDRERAVLSQQADGLVASAHREERALLGPHGQRAHDVAGDRGDVVAGCRHRAHEVQLGSRHPAPGALVLVDEPSCRSAERRRCVVGRVRSARRARSATVSPPSPAPVTRRRSEAARAIACAPGTVADGVLSMMWTICDRQPTSQTPARQPAREGGRWRDTDDEGVHVIDKTYATAAEAVADIPDGASWPSAGSASRAARSPSSRRCSRRGRRTSPSSPTTAAWTTGARRPAERQADPQDDLVLRRREQGVRAAVPLR